MGEAFLRKRAKQYIAQVERTLEHQTQTPELFDAATAHRRTVVADLVNPNGCMPDETVFVALTAHPVEVRRGLEVVAVLIDQYADQAREYAAGRSEVFAKIGPMDFDLGICELFLVRPTVVS